LCRFGGTAKVDGSQESKGSLIAQFSIQEQFFNSVEQSVAGLAIGRLGL
jgi:hypothetical protein